MILSQGSYLRPETAIEGGVHEVVDRLADESPCHPALCFLRDGEEHEERLNRGELATRARLLASRLVRRNVTGKPVILALPPSCEFVIALLACWHAGAIAVPAYPATSRRQRDRLNAILHDSGAQWMLSSSGIATPPGIEVMNVDSLDATDHEFNSIRIESNSPCLLQYTSGSTASPKGVIISHHHLRSHYAAATSHWKGQEIQSALSWLPPYHDMGLVLKILYSLEAGIPLTFFPAEHFVQRPIRWLRAISRHRAELSGAPNFAYDMCVRRIRDEELVGLDLSCWKVAPCGAERVRAETLERFAERFAPFGFDDRAFMPGYGMAETTLVVTAKPSLEPLRHINHPQAGRLVSCGVPLAGVGISISDPITGSRLPDGEVGEIRVTGPTVTSGYWNQAAIIDPKSETGDFLGIHTGDLGLMADGNLYVTGRIKEIIILDGINHSPEDIEGVVLREIPEIEATAAFAIGNPDGEGVGLALEMSTTDPEAVEKASRSARHHIGEQLGLPVQSIFVLRSRLIPRTTSGKLRRHACREALESGSLKAIHIGREKSQPSPPVCQSALRDVLDAVESITGRRGAAPDDHVIGYGMSSIEVTRLAARLLERRGARIPIGRLFSSNSFAEIAHALSVDAPSIQSHPLVEADAGHEGNRLTHSQERMWFLHRIDPSSAAYHVFGTLELKGQLDLRRLESSIEALIHRHAILRSRHVENNGAVEIHLTEPTPFKLPCVFVKDDREAQRQLQSFASQPFHLQTDTPFRACLFRLSEDVHALGICAHHIVMDGWSMRLLANELAELYSAPGESSPSTESDYLAYASWHRGWIESGAVDEQVDYWCKRLKGHPGRMSIAADFPRPAVPSSAGNSVEVTVPASLREGIAEVARAHRATPFMVHLAAFLMQLRHLGATDDPLVAIPVANRHHPGSGELVGTLVNTLPFRLTLDPEESIRSLILRIREASLEMQSAQDAPFERILEVLGASRSRNHAPLVQVMFDHQELPMPEMWKDGLRCTPVAIHRGAVQFDLSLLLLSMNDRQQIAVEYRSDLFLCSTARTILERHLECLRQICLDAGQSLSSISQLSPTELKLLDSASHGPVRPAYLEQTTPSLIAERVEALPDKSAVKGEGGSLTYRDLEALSNSISANLRGKGIGRGDRVAVILERNVHLPAVLLAIWKAGAAYVPIDPSHPAGRTAQILADQSPLSVVAADSLLELLPSETPALKLSELMETGPSTGDRIRIDPEDAAYILYTSGSTGRPKGVVVTHGALANFLLSMAESPGFTAEDSLLAITTISFDISILELFLPLVTGGQLEVVPASVSRDGTALIERLQSSKATTFQATPATWRMLIEAGWSGSPNLRILCGGEALDAPLARKLVQLGGSVWNLYGPTETTIWSTLWNVTGQPETILIGTPIANTGVHVLAPDGSVRPPGVPGELWISGSGLARGYWNQDELTKRKFTTIIDLHGEPVLAYRTGDIARWRHDGGLECLGREDGQIKIRGFRIELGEVEAAIASHPDVAFAKASCRGDNPESKRIVAWFTARPGAEIPSGSSLHAHLSEKLPHYMIPSAIGHVEAFPLNANGKVDTSGLMDPTDEGSKDSPLPETETELQLAGIWKELLNRPSIRPTDDWFESGGHSLLVMRLFSRIHQQMNVALPLSVILQAPTLRELAAAIDQSASKTPVSTS